MVKAVEELKRAGIKTLKDEEWEIEDGIVMKERRIYVPKGKLRGGNNIIALQYPSRRAWRKMEDNGIGY